MIEQLYTESIRKILQNKKILENALKIKIFIKDRILTMSGKPEDEFIAIQALEAINLGFGINEALLLKNEEFAFEKINIKGISRRKDLSQVRGRVIGEGGKALRVVEELSGCYIVVHGNTVGIIGDISDVKKAAFSIKKLISGSKHANIYKYLEEQKALEKQSF